ncbi:linear amide C-N hydrolase [Micromonospora sp. NPDC003197]
MRATTVGSAPTTGSRNIRATIALALTLVVAGCAGAPTADQRDANSESVVSASRQSAAEAEQTLASLRRVDDLPLYAMTYAGDYDALVDLAASPTPSPFGCSLFMASGDPARPLYGRNFDWDPNPGLVLQTDPPDGYASISLVDMGYLGINADPSGDRRLLNAPLLPFDGMNERGLVVGLAADDSGSLTPDPAKPTVGSVRILRLVLDQAATVDEAVAVIDRYNLDFDGGPPLHYLIADASGASAVVEFVDGRMRVLPGGPPWQVLTNIRLADASEAARQRDRRYATAAAHLTRANGVVDWQGAMEILQAVAQSHTRWSVTYEPRTGAVHVVTGQRWSTVHDFNLRMAG